MPCALHENALYISLASKRASRLEAQAQRIRSGVLWIWQAYGALPRLVYKVPNHKYAVFASWNSLSSSATWSGDLVEINSGGLVLFCFFAPPPHTPFAPENVLVAKFHASRLTTQSEQFANELTRHLGICAPNCRILRQQVRRFL